MKVYLAGPMSGIKAFNIPAFDEAAKHLRIAGYEVISPAEVDGPVDREILLRSEHGSHDDLPSDAAYGGYLGRDVEILMSQGIEAIITLPGWKNSRGARIEVAVAKELGIPHAEFADIVNFEHWELEQLGRKEGHTELIDTHDGVIAVDVPRNGPLYDENFVPYSENPERQRAVTGAVKDNRSKTRVDLLPAEALEQVGLVLAAGAVKYKPNNWRLGLSWTQTMGSILRHLYAFMRGEDNDPETGYSHIAHAACQTLFLLTYVLTKTGEDDRWSSQDDHSDSVA